MIYPSKYTGKFYIFFIITIYLVLNIGEQELVVDIMQQNWVLTPFWVNYKLTLTQFGFMTYFSLALIGKETKALENSKPGKFDKILAFVFS